MLKIQASGVIFSLKKHWKDKESEQNSKLTKMIISFESLSDDLYMKEEDNEELKEKVKELQKKFGC